MIRFAVSFVAGLLPAITFAADPQEAWVPLKVAEVSLEAPFAFLPKRDGTSSLPAEVKGQFVSFDIYESDTSPTFPMAVNVMRMEYHEAAQANLDATSEGSLRAVAEAQNDKDAPVDKNIASLDGLDSRRLFYNGIGRGKPVSVETLAARQGPVLWTVMVTYNDKVPRESVVRLLDSVHILHGGSMGALALPGGGAVGGKWYITSLKEMTLECPFQFPAPKDALPQLPDETRAEFVSYQTWEGSGRPSTPLDVTISRLAYKEGAEPTLEQIALAQIKAIARRSGDDENVIGSAPLTRDGLSGRNVQYDGLARGKQMSTRILLAQEGPHVWILQATWSASLSPGLLDRVFDSIHIITPDPDIAISQAKDTRRSLGEDLMQTYGWCQGQQHSLEAIALSVPELADEATRARLEWLNAFKGGEEGVALRLKTLAGKDWPSIEANFENLAARTRSAQFQKQEALDYIAQVRQRSRARIESPFREMLLASDAFFVQEPVQEFKAGYVMPFSTAGKAKAGPLRLQFKVPLSWAARDSDAPDVVREWTSDGGHGNDYIRLMTSKLPPALSADTVEDAFTDHGARDLLPKGANFLRFAKGRLLNQPLGITHFTVTLPPGDDGKPGPSLRCVMYYFIGPGYLVSIQCMAGAAEASATAHEERFTRLEPLFKAVAGSLVPET